MTPFLFSVDVEDLRMRAPGGGRHPERVSGPTLRYLEFLRRHQARGTFFVVGDVARAQPELVRRIVAEGHEIACHSDGHVPLDRQTPAAFREDLCRNLEALRRAGAGEVQGYRAPCFSLVEGTRWAYAVLAELGISWSSSVLPARSPLYGWPGFGARPRMVDGVLEMPVTVGPYAPVPVAGGVYFRVLPRALVRRALRARQRAGEAVPGYLHPYDADTDPPHFPHPDFSRWSPLGWLMHANRGAVLERLEMVARLGFAFQPYGRHADALRATLSPPAAAHAGA